MKTIDFTSKKIKSSTCEFFTKVDRVISGDVRIKVRSSDKGSQTNLRTKEISIDFSEARHDSDAKNFAVLKGLNYHELAHQEFTIVQTGVNTRSLGSVINGMEDGRIETLYSRKYPKTKEYFVTTFLSVLWRHRKKTAPTQFLSVYARRLLLDEKYVNFYEHIFRDKYGDEVTDKVKELITEYVGCSDSVRLFDIAVEVEKLINDKPTLETDPVNNRAPVTSSVRQTTASEEAKELSKEISEELEDTENDGELDEETKKKLDKKLAEQKKQKQKTDNLNKEVEKQNAKSKQINDEMLDELRKKLNGKTEDEKNEIQKKVDELKEKLRQSRDMANKKWTEACESKDDEEELDVSEEIGEELTEEIECNVEDIEEDIEREMNIAVGNKGKEIEYESNPTSILPETRALSKELASIFRALKNDNKRGNVTGLKSGNIYIKRAMTFRHTGDLNIFQKTLPDYAKKQRMGVIILIDTSGSMGGQRIGEVTQGAWAVKEALSNTDNKVAVIGYNTTHRLIKGFYDGGDFGSISDGGGTDPTSALALTKDLIKKEASIRNWLVIIMTDGEWENNPKTETYLSDINKMALSTETVLVSLGNTKAGKNCKHRFEIHNVEDLRKIFVELVNKTRHHINNNIKQGVL